MPVPGVSVFHDLQAALEKVRAEAKALHDDWTKIDTQFDELVAERGTAFIDLARHYLPDLTQQSIANTLTQIQGDLRAILDRKERRVAELTGQLERLVVERDKSSDELAEITSRLNEKVRQRDLLQQQVTQTLSENPQFKHLTEQAVASELELHRNEQRVREIMREADEKLPAYEQSRLFQYLYRRGFGTPAYASRGLTRRLDRWVGRMIEFQQSRKSYEFLKSTPGLMQAEVERRHAEFDEQMNAIEAFERREADSSGLTVVLDEGEQLGWQRDGLVKRVDEQKQRCQEVEQELIKLQQSQGQFYEEALTRFRTFLSQTETAVLEHHARKTPEPTDDELVSRVKWLSTEIDRLQPQVVAISSTYRNLEEQASGLDFVLRRYQQSNFDSERSSFENGFDVDEYIDRFRKGVTDKDSLWQSIRSRQDFAPTWIEQTAGGASNVLEHPLAQVLAQAMVQAAGAALQQSANRSVTRRTGQHRGGTGIPINVPTPTFRRTNGPSFGGRRGGGFTSGKGF
ncbi:MAG: hypothetical protein R3C02_15865 [Planctomycetaceae bacterium]